jgi:glycerol-3-phosphate dehydrogenase
MKSTLSARNPCFRNLAGNDPLDVLIVGGGMSGAPLYHELCGRGYRVGLIDKGDFSSGTSQASGMLALGRAISRRNGSARLRRSFIARDRTRQRQPDPPAQFLPP